ncbi:four helix bundle suffix domain-containing protein [Chlorobaculum sp. MV4-Y]|uniref:four helix bundle suffix domain-containing protein n=1 Tax=Chlorobaculum sp. MV4-Y TaxID=2976335 RepID=UPI0021AEBF67|nr:four helix bundle suffix domain-containing protein [Chlorobaculum sp. MV4-Y]UWX58045.1 four helix bundle suffix domain-containing protein [Chlorobaculum sp. MV4-Y]
MAGSGGPRKLLLREKNSREALFVRKLSRERGVSYESFREFVETRPAEVVANIAICLINQASFLLKRQLETLERQFIEAGGIRERMTKARLDSRQKR